MLAVNPLSAEILLNNVTAGAQQFTGVAMDNSGNFVATWSSYGQDGSGAGVYARRFDATGAAIGSEFLVNTFTTGDQVASSIAMSDTGDFVISWLSKNQDGSGDGIFAQRFNAAGVKQGSEFQVNQYTTYNQNDVSIAMDSDGDFVISWSSGNSDPFASPQPQDGFLYGVYARRYNASGVAQGNEFRVNDTTDSYEAVSSVAMDDAGNFVISWTQFDLFGTSELNIFAKRYNAAGTAIGGAFQVNSITTMSQVYSSVAMDADGDFVIAFGSNHLDNVTMRSDIFARRYNSSGVAQGAEFLVNTYATANQFVPVVSMDSAGNFVIAWNSGLKAEDSPTPADQQDGSFYGIYARRYTASGVADGGEVQINTYTTGNQVLPSIAVNASGNFVVAWSSDGQDGSGYGNYARLYTDNNLPVANAGGPYVINEGSSLLLDASASSDLDNDVLTYSWDINGDNVFGDATGVSPSLTWAQLVALGITDGPGNFNVKVRVNDGQGGIVDSTATTLTVNNVAPTASFTLPALGLRGGGANGNGVRGQARSITLSATDPGTADTIFTFAINWGDGSPIQYVVGASGTIATKTYATAATFNISVTATDDDGGVSLAVQQNMKIVDWDLQQASGLTNLVWGGTNGFDAFGFAPGIVLIQGLNNQFFPNPQIVFTGGFTGKLIVYGQGSGDLIFADVINANMEVYGGDGDDVIVGGRGSDILDGGNGSDIIFGGTLESDGNDTIFGGAGSDLIIGHLGADWLYGGNGEDMLIAGRINFDPLPAATYALQSEWISGRPYQTRIDNMTGVGAGPRNNQNYFLIPGSTAIDDGAVDRVFGEGDTDWMLLDQATELALSDLNGIEIATDV